MLFETTTWRAQADTATHATAVRAVPATPSATHRRRGDDPAPAAATIGQERTSPGRRHSGGDPEFAHLTAALGEFAALGPTDPGRARLRDRLVAGYLPLARRIARRYAHRGEPIDDLAQVAALGLINALDRYRPELGNDFLSYAVPTITGEVRRYFRDQGWGMRVIRRHKDLRLAINNATTELTHQHGAAPRPSQIAEYLDLPLEDVIEGLQAAQAYRPDSLDAALEADPDNDSTLADLVGQPDADLEMVDYHESLQPLLDDLPARERRILMMRFFGNMTQSQIGAKCGISQMHVSRLLAQALAKLREQLLAEAP